MTTFANWKLARKVLSYDGYSRLDLYSTQQNQPIAKLNLLIKLWVTVALLSELIPMAIIFSSDFTLMELTQQQDKLQPSSLPFSLGTTTAFYDGQFLKLFISASGTSRTHSMGGRKREPPFRRPTYSLKNDAFAVALYKFIPDSKFFGETDGYIIKDTYYIEVSFSDLIVQKSSIQPLPIPPSP